MFTIPEPRHVAKHLIPRNCGANGSPRKKIGAGRMAHCTCLHVAAPMVPAVVIVATVICQTVCNKKSISLGAGKS